MYRTVRFLPPHKVKVQVGNAGPYLVAYNVIKSRPGKQGPELIMTWAEQALVDNTFTVPNPVETGGRHRVVDERVVAPATISSAVPTLPGAPELQKRTVFDLPAGANASAIQHALDEAAKLSGRRPVVHLPMGVYKIDHTLSIPAGCDLQMIGDGGAETGSVLEWTGMAGQPLLRLAGPSRATLRDFFLQARAGIGILAENCDQAGGVVLIALDGFHGDFTLLTSLLLPVGSDYTARIAVTGDSSATNALCMADLFWQNRFGTTTDMVWQDTSSPLSHAAFLLCNLNIGAKPVTDAEKKANGFGNLDNRGTADDAFVRKMLAPLREGRTSPPVVKPGATDLQMHRLMIVTGRSGQGIVLQRKP